MSILSLRRHRSTVQDEVAATATALSKSRATLLSGKNVRFRFGQMLLWSVLAALVGAQLIFGLYDAVLQIHWYITIPRIPLVPAWGIVFPGWHQNLFWLKHSWDADCFGLVHSANWWLYRHLAFRDIAGPALATMAVKTFLAAPKWWTPKKPVSTLRIVTAPFVLIAMTFGLGILGVYLAYFGLPDLWAHFWSAVGHPGYRVTRLSVLGKLSLNQILIGVIIGQVLHRYWAPVGATLQAVPLDRSVDRWQSKILGAGMTLEDAVRYTNNGLTILPLSQRKPVWPPILRERWAILWRANKKITARNAHTRVVMVVIFLLTLVVLLGFVGHYWVGTLHHTVPYLFPGQ